MKITFDSTNEFADILLACKEINTKGKCAFCPLNSICDKANPVVKNAEIRANGANFKK